MGGHSRHRCSKRQRQQQWHVQFRPLLRRPAVCRPGGVKAPASCCLLPLRLKRIKLVTC